MKKIIVLIVAIMLVAGTVVAASTRIPTETETKASTETETYEERVYKEIREIHTLVCYNSVTVVFDDDSYLDSNWHKFFFTETRQNECVIKKYDSKGNLMYVHVFYNPDTTIIK